MFLLLAVATGWLLANTRRTEQSMRDRMRALFRLSMSSPGAPPSALYMAVQEQGFIRGIRSSKPYQVSLQYLKWRALPALAAVLIYLSFAAVLYGAASVVHRAQLAFAAESLCQAHSQSVGEGFSTTSMCWRVGVEVKANQRYVIRLLVTEPWSDGNGKYATTPEGFSTHRFPLWLRGPAALLRRSLNHPWFSPIVHVERYTGGRAPLVSVAMHKSEDEQDVYVGAFTAPADGELVLFVNDAVFLWWGEKGRFYANNAGTADVQIDECYEDATPRCGP